MFEWIGGDPLVGVFTTIGFFTFLIVGYKFKLYRLKHQRAKKK